MYVVSAYEVQWVQLNNIIVDVYINEAITSCRLNKIDRVMVCDKQFYVKKHCWFIYSC